MNKRIVLRSIVVSSALMLSITAGLTTAVYAEPPAKPGESSEEVKHKAAFEYSETSSEADKTYNSEEAGVNAILALDGTANFTRPLISKKGDDNSGDSADFYGTNAAVLSINSSKIKMMGGEINTNAKHANAVFAYGNSTIDLTDTKINTMGDNSGALMVAGGGTLSATNVTAETAGNSSAPIRSDRGGGEMMITGGEFKSNGSGSPVIYSTAEVTVKDGAKLESTASEGVVIEGANSVTLDNVSLITNNTQLHGNSETYKSYFIYQSMSGDAEQGTGRLSIKNSSTHTKNGDVFFVTNTNASISITKSSFTHEKEGENAFLRATASKWGRDGQNGGNVTLDVRKSPITGAIVVDSVSTANIMLSERAYLKGAINTENTAKSLKIRIDDKSRIVLTGDSYISELKNSVSDNSNIFANGHKLFVDGKEVSINQSEPEEWEYDFSTDSTEPIKEQETEKKDKTLLYVLLGASGILFIVALSSVFRILGRDKKAKRRRAERAAMKKVNSNNMKKPWEKR